MPEPASLHLSRVSKFYGQIQALDDISFSVGTGEIVGRVGPSGAGKSTLFQLAAGLFSPVDLPTKPIL